MKSAPYIAGISILLILAMAVGLVFNNRGSEQQPPVSNVATSTVTTNTDQNPQPQPSASDMIHVSLPTSGQVVGKSFELKGEARGNWYFEASFPARVEDANGKVLAQFPVSAKGDWMTTDFVPFDQIIKIATSTTATGNLILEKDNPSGLPQNEMKIVIPIRFATSTSALSGAFAR